MLLTNFSETVNEDGEYEIDFYDNENIDRRKYFDMM